MAIDKSIPIPLFTENSVGHESAFFHVFPGEVALLQAFGFQPFKSREPGHKKAEQAACLEMLLFKEGTLPEREQCKSPLLDLSHYRGELMAAEQVRYNNCIVSMSMCNNIMLLNIPGSYRFIMDDATAVGNVRIYLRIFSKDEFPWNSKLFVGA